MTHLFDDESVVTESADKQVTLTSHRIIYSTKEWGKLTQQSIMLEHITSCENETTSKPMLKYVGYALIGLGIINLASSQQEGLLVALAGGALLGWYYMTMNNFVKVASPSSRITIPMGGSKAEVSLAFINQIEQAKHTRIKTLHAGRTAV